MLTLKQIRIIFEEALNEYNENLKTDESEIELNFGDDNNE